VRIKTKDLGNVQFENNYMFYKKPTEVNRFLSCGAVVEPLAGTCGSVKMTKPVKQAKKLVQF